jgi:hypothetical protein
MIVATSEQRDQDYLLHRLFAVRTSSLGGLCSGVPGWPPDGSEGSLWLTHRAGGGTATGLTALRDEWTTNKAFS